MKMLWALDSVVETAKDMFAMIELNWLQVRKSGGVLLPNC